MTFQPSERIIAFIKSFEKCRLKAYLPTPYDKPTCGWGTTGPDVTLSTVWTQDQCDARFARDLARFAANASAQIGNAPTTQSQFDAMLSLAYNIGMANFAISSVLREHKAGNYAKAANHFIDWNKQRQKGVLVVLNGLTRRRQAEAAIYLEDS